jgi:serine/threonine protein kinase
VIHRDLKLENILFADAMKMRIKIVDFGIAGIAAKNVEGEQSDLGSLLYVAPEVLSGADRSATPALDVWSMGCIFYAMLTGELPFTGASTREIAKNILTCSYKRLSQFPHVSKPWHKLVS